MNEQAERDWYDQEEGGMVDDTHNPFVGDESTFAKREEELQKKLVRNRCIWIDLSQGFQMMDHLCLCRFDCVPISVHWSNDKVSG